MVASRVDTAVMSLDKGKQSCKALSDRPFDFRNQKSSSKSLEGLVKTLKDGFETACRT